MPMLPVSWGEVFDKLTILQIKSVKIKDSAKLVNIMREKAEIETVAAMIANPPEGLTPLIDQLRAVNTELWDIEDGKRDCERRQCFDEAFIQLARQVYIKNDRRAAIKKDINTILGSVLSEEKSYAAY
ncbi:MAG: hypothetical protein EPN21_09405 [Methylococcaceae bacterium]|nr:MAG: hypothetical protein EPN21_09405 [Methylococcaceae bacterium]